MSGIPSPRPLVEYAAEIAPKFDTAVASAFRRALGIPDRPSGGRSPKGARNSAHDGTRRPMAQSHGVRGLQST